MVVINPLDRAAIRAAATVMAEMPDQKRSHNYHPPLADVVPTPREINQIIAHNHAKTAIEQRAESAGGLEACLAIAVVHCGCERLCQPYIQKGLLSREVIIAVREECPCPRCSKWRASRTYTITEKGREALRKAGRE